MKSFIFLFKKQLKHAENSKNNLHQKKMPSQELHLMRRKAKQEYPNLTFNKAK